MFKIITLISIAMALSACGGSGGSSDLESAEDESGNPVFNFDASKLAYFAVKQGSGDWQEMDRIVQSIEVTDTKGDLSFVTVCDKDNSNYMIRDVTVSHLRLKKDVTQIPWCEGVGSLQLEGVIFSPAQADIRISGLSSKNLVEVRFLSEQASATFSDLAGEHELVASAYDYSTMKAYLYRGTFSALEEGSTYTIDFFGDDSVTLETFSTAEIVNGFYYSYDYQPAIMKSWPVYLYAGNSMQGKVPVEFIQEGDLFKHYYGFGYDSQISVFSDNQVGVNPLSAAPVEYTTSDLTISDDNLSLSFTPKPSPLDSLIPSFHGIYIESDAIDYIVNAERFSEFGNTLTLMDFSLLPNFNWDMPSGTMADIYEVTSYYLTEEEGVNGSQRLFISSNLSSN
ncbi:MAG: hypothetical protein ACI910_000677 [Oleispira sp.]|jgi:hypothetical protein